jgi:hypothetical protein
MGRSFKESSTARYALVLKRQSAGWTGALIVGNPFLIGLATSVLHGIR